MKKFKFYFTKGEIALWIGSVAVIATSFLIFDRQNFLTLAASLVGVTSLIFIAKGNPIGQLLTIAFSVLYGIISYGYSYYGEMITYLGMTAPMAAIALISWLRNPYKGNRAEVKINRLKRKEIIFMIILTLAVTAAFYFILRAFNTANLIPSTISVTTSFAAVYLTFRRSAAYAAAYALNDVVLITLWIMATIENITYISVVMCFVAFFANDVYGFINWRRMRKAQEEGSEPEETAD